MPITRVPAVLDALMALLPAAVGQAVTVLDGPRIGYEVGAEAICVGMPSESSEPGYDSTVNRQDGMGRPRYVEAWSVSVLLSLTTGETDGTVERLRARAGELLQRIDVALTDAVTGNVWQRATFGPLMQWVPIADESGSALWVFFKIQGTSLL